MIMCLTLGGSSSRRKIRFDEPIIIVLHIFFCLVFKRSNLLTHCLFSVDTSRFVRVENKTSNTVLAVDPVDPSKRPSVICLRLTVVQLMQSNNEYYFY